MRCKSGAYRKATLRDAALLRVRGRLSRNTVIPDVIRGPERQARFVRVALDTRLREYDGAWGFILILRRRGSAVSKEGL